MTTNNLSNSKILKTSTNAVSCLRMSDIVANSKSRSAWKSNKGAERFQAKSPNWIFQVGLILIRSPFWWWFESNLNKIKKLLMMFWTFFYTKSLNLLQFFSMLRLVTNIFYFVITTSSYLHLLILNCSTLRLAHSKSKNIKTENKTLSLNWRDLAYPRHKLCLIVLNIRYKLYSLCSTIYK
jgi:hypothetical protein